MGLVALARAPGVTVQLVRAVPALALRAALQGTVRGALRRVVLALGLALGADRCGVLRQQRLQPRQHAVLVVGL